MGFLERGSGVCMRLGTEHGSTGVKMAAGGDGKHSVPCGVWRVSVETQKYSGSLQLMTADSSLGLCSMLQVQMPTGKLPAKLSSTSSTCQKNTSGSGSSS